MPPVLNKSELFIFDGEMFTFMTWNSRNLNLLKCHCLNMASNKSNKKIYYSRLFQPPTIIICRKMYYSNGQYCKQF